MRSTAVLVLSTDVSGRLVEALQEIGLHPLIRKTQQEALSVLHHWRFPAIVVDRYRNGVDALEFVLNVRDLDAETPILVIGQGEDAPGDRALQVQPQVHFVPQRPSRIRQEVQALLEG